MASSDPKAFWEARIESWDASRHEGKKNALSFLHWATKNPDESVHFRNQVVLEHITPHIQGKRVVELGCGTGRMALELMERGAGSYCGYDFTPSGIRIAQKRIEKIERNDLRNSIHFELADIATLQKIEADFVFSMGLFYWIPPPLIDHVFSISQGIDFLHNFSEKIFNPRQVLKFLFARSFYRNLKDHKSSSRKIEIIANIPKQYGFQNVHCLRHQKLYDAVCISSKVFPETLGPSITF